MRTHRHRPRLHFNRHWRRCCAVGAIAIIAVALTSAAGRSSRQQTTPGPQPDGSTLLINNWTVTPAGTQVTLTTPDNTGGNLPLAEALSPDGAYLVVLNGGAGIESLQVVDTASAQVVQTVPFKVPDAVYQGLAFSPDGSALYATGGGSNKIFAFDVVGGQLINERDGSIFLSGEAYGPVSPIGLAVSPDGKTLWVADNLANDIRAVDAATLSPHAGIRVGHFPYAVALTPDGGTLYVSNWDDEQISVIDTAAGIVTSSIEVGYRPYQQDANHIVHSHPTAMALRGDRLYVTLANVDMIAVVDLSAGKTIGWYSLLPYAGAPLGASPESLALSLDGQRLYVANAGDNDVAVIDLTIGQVSALVPTAWYPTAVVLSPAADRLYVANGKGLGAGPNNRGNYPNPAARRPIDRTAYVATMIPGTLSIVPLDGSDLAEMTAQVRQSDRFDQQLAAHPGTQPLPVQAGGVSPIKHVIYIIKENRTYDQVFGDIKQLQTGTDGDGKANGDGSLTLFGRQITPNQHALASQYVLFDNFYDDAEVSPDGHNWSTGAFATDYNERNWPQTYSATPGRNRPYDFEGNGTANLNAGGYLWDAAAAAGISYRDYGEWVSFDDTVTQPDGTQAPLRVQSASQPCPGPVTTRYTSTKVHLQPDQAVCFGPQSADPSINPNLAGRVSAGFRRFDNDYPDQDRFVAWNAEFQQFVANGNLPALEIVRFPDDHTQGAAAGQPSPASLVHDNDAAVGQLVDAVSRSPYWASTAIFVLEDDAQDGPDHVDAHRSTALVISPYTRHAGGFVDHTQYDTASLLRTMELILGLPPLSQYDAGAVPMMAAFASTPDLAPFTAIAPDPAILDQRNPPNTAAASLSEHLDFSREDRADPAILNQAIWMTIKGTKQMPSPVHNWDRVAPSSQSNEDK